MKIPNFTLKFSYFFFIYDFFISETTIESKNQFKNTVFSAETVFIYDLARRKKDQLNSV